MTIVYTNLMELMAAAAAAGSIHQSGMVTLLVLVFVIVRTIVAMISDSNPYLCWCLLSLER